MPLPDFLSSDGSQEEYTARRVDAYEARLVKQVLAARGDPSLEARLRARRHEVTGSSGLLFAWLADELDFWPLTLTVRVLDDHRLPDPLSDRRGATFRRCPAGRALEDAIEAAGGSDSAVGVVFRRGHTDAVLHNRPDLTVSCPHVAYVRKAGGDLAHLVGWKDFLGAVLGGPTASEFHDDGGSGTIDEDSFI
jgi:hypothetical protein